MGQDARVRYTKMMIRQNFISLLQQKPLNKITVKEVCELAEINRATFYKYYADAYDLLEQLEADIFEDLQNVMRDSVQEGVQKTMTRILEQMKENGSTYITLFSSNGDPNFPTRIFQICYREMAENICQQFPKLSKTEQAWLYVYMAQGSSGILNHWLSGGMEESPRDVAGFIERLISSTMHSIG